MSEENKTPENAPEATPEVVADKAPEQIVRDAPVKSAMGSAVIEVPKAGAVAPSRPQRGGGRGGNNQRGGRGGRGGNQRGGRGGNQRGGRGGRGGQGRGRRDQQKPVEEEESNLIEKVVHINRCAKVVKGGRRFSFSALVVVGDGEGKVGVGYGKAKEVPECIRKGTEQAKKNMIDIQLKTHTIPHVVNGRHDGGRVLLKPAVAGTGVIAGGGVRAVLESCGIKDVLSKSLGSNTPAACVFATLDGLKQLRHPDTIKRIKEAE